MSDQKIGRIEFRWDAKCAEQREREELEVSAPRPDIEGLERLYADIYGITWVTTENADHAVLRFMAAIKVAWPALAAYVKKLEATVRELDLSDGPPGGSVGGAGFDGDDGGAMDGGRG